MTNQRHPVHLSIASSTEIEDTARRLKAAREEFLSAGNLQYPPRQMILDSWQRCRAMQVNPSLRSAPLAITREVELHRLREDSWLLIRAARSVMDHLSDFLADSGYVVVLSDANGRLLEVIGDAKVRRRLARIDFVPGGDWSEAAAGTNALGTAIADGHVVQLLGAEHYCEGWHDLTCTAAPIRHPLSGEIIGILDATGNYRLIRPFLSSFIAATALQVQQEMGLLLSSTRKGKSRTKSHAIPFDFPGGASIPVDADLRRQQASKPSTENSLRSSMPMQERRVPNAEFLAATVGAISASLDVDITLEKVAEQTAYLLRLDTASVCLFDENDEIVSLHTWSKQYARRVKSHSDLGALLRQSEVVSQVRERGEPLIINDALASVFLPTALVKQSGVRSLLLLPLITAHGVIGFILAPKYTCYHWMVDDVLPGLTLAAHAATAIENARHFTMLQQHTHRLEVINMLAQLLSNLSDPDLHLDVVLKRIVEIMDLEAGVALLCEQYTDRLLLAAHYGLPEAVPLDLCKHPLRSLYEIADLVTTTGKSLMACRIERDERTLYEPLDTAGFCDVMIVPLATDSTILGVLLVGNLSHRKLTTEDLTLFTTIGQQLGLALVNVRLRRAANETEALREADQLKSEFVAAVSHDLQSPLTAIRTSVESLLDQGGVHTTRTQEHLLHNIAGQTSRLDRLVEQLLDLSRIEAGALSLAHDWIELPALIVDTLAKFEELHNGCQVELDLGVDVPLLYVDPDRIAQVLWNLLENASKYALSHTPLRVEVRSTENETLVGVADRGPGVPLEEREKIFQHFYRMKRNQRTSIQGSGLGLAICQGIVQAHGGRIWVEERPGGGSIFRFALPLLTTNFHELEPLEQTEQFDVSTGGV